MFPLSLSSGTYGTISGSIVNGGSSISATIGTAVTGSITGAIGTPGPAGVGVPAGGTTGQVLAKASGTNYDTAWTTLSLTGYATESWVTAGFYPLTGNPSGYAQLSGATFSGTVYGPKFQNLLNADFVIDSYNDTGAGTHYLHKFTPFDGKFVLAPNGGGLTFPDNTTQTTAATNFDPSGYATESWVTAGFYPLTGNPSGFLTSAALSGYATESWVTAGFAPIAAGQPTAGATGQVLTKNSGTNYDSSWTTLPPAGDRYLTTSTTTNTVSNGTKSFTIGTGLSYTVTQNVTISYNGANHMHGEVLSYDSGTGALSVDVNHHTGSGTYSAWTVNVGGVTPATSVAWGGITGTLSSQIDLINALSQKYDASNPSGFISDAPSDGSQYARKDAAWEVVSTPPDFITSVSAPLSVASGVLSIDLSTYATQTFVTTQGYLDTNGVAAMLAPYATLASPSLSGTPTSPTAPLGTNTTQIATTAFVQSALPVMATETQAIYGTSSTTTISPLLMRYILANPMLTTYNSLVGNYSSFVSGSGAVSAVWSNLFGVQITAANGKAAFQPNSQVSYHSIQSRGKVELTVDWTKPMWFSFRFCYSSAGSIGDSNTINRVTIGKVSSTFGDLTSRGIGVKWTAGTAGAFTVMAHNGTTLSTSASAVTVSNTTYFPTTSSAADFMVYSDGTGNVTLYCNNVQVATTTGGPSSGTSPGPRFVFECDNTTSTSGSVTCDFTGVKSMLAY